MKGAMMYTLKLEIEDSIIDKVKVFLQQLPQGKVKIHENNYASESSEDFISYLVSHPINTTDNSEFLSRVDANAR
jgi:hypothetical protein